MNLEISWGHTFNVDDWEPQLNIETVFSVGGKRVLTRQSFTRSQLEGFVHDVSIFEIIKVAAGAILQAADAIEDKRKRVSRAAMLDAALAGGLGLHMLNQRPNGLDRRKLH